MRAFGRLACAAVLPVALPRAVAAQTVRPDQVVWHWFTGCAGRDSLSLRIVFDGQPLYSAVFPICHLRHGDIKPDPEERVLTFHFSAAPSRFRAQSSRAVQPLNGSIWESGSDPYALHLGVSVATEEMVLLNMTHVAKPDQSSRTERVRGMVITTSPVQGHR